MKKKLLSLTLALALCLGLTVPALAAGKPGDTTVADRNGAITFSNPILYTLSRSDLEQVDMDSMNVSIEGEAYDADFYGPLSDYLDMVFWSKVTTVYAIPSGTKVEFPDGVLTSNLVNFDVEWKSGTCRVTDFEVVLLPGYDSITLSGAGFILINLSRTSVEGTTSFDGTVGIEGSAIGDSDAGSICIFIAEDSQKTNPFSSTTPTTPSTPNTPSVPSTPGKPTFTDVEAGAYYADSVAWAVEKSITSGTSATTFSPNELCSTAQILTFLWRANGSPEPTSKTNPFTDVQESDYYYKAALWAKEKNVLPLPFNPTLGGNEPCTRGMAVMYIWRATGFDAAKTTSNFTDVAATTIYAPAVDWAVETGVTSGTSNTTFSPNSTCTRGQIVTFLYRAYGK